MSKSARHPERIPITICRHHQPQPIPPETSPTATKSLVASGFATREEVIGKPHNIVRHPGHALRSLSGHGPPCKRGRPWSGIVRTGARMATSCGSAPLPPPSPTVRAVSVRIIKPRRNRHASALMPAHAGKPGSVWRRGGWPTGLTARLSRLLPRANPRDVTDRPDQRRPVRCTCIRRRCRACMPQPGPGTPWTRSFRSSPLLGADPRTTPPAPHLKQLADAGPPPSPPGGSTARTQRGAVCPDRGGLSLAVLATPFCSSACRRSIGRADMPPRHRGGRYANLPPSGDELGSLIVHMAVMRNNLHELIASIRNEVGILLGNAAA